MKYEVFIKPGFSGADIEADNANEAAQKFVDIVLENLDVEHVVVNNLDTDDGNDPSPNAERDGSQDTVGAEVGQDRSKTQ